MKLYGYWRSSSAWRVRLGLELKSIPYENIPVHLVKGEHREPAHRDRNPLAQVPVLELEDGGRTVALTQSVAILELLDELYPQSPLLPGDAFARARARELTEVINSGIQPLQNLAVLLRVEKLGGDKVAWGREIIETGLTALGRAVSGETTRFLTGDKPGMADVFLTPQLYNARRFDVPLKGLERLVKIEAACAALPAFQRAHPDSQPDRIVS